jgi:hypothetical protein
MLIMVPPPPPPTGSLVEATVRATATSDIVVRPRLVSSSALMVVRGRAFSEAMRLIEEPVTSTRCIGASWAAAPFVRTSTATATADKRKRCSLVRVFFTACLLRVIVNRVRVCPRLARMDTSRIRAVATRAHGRGQQAVKCRGELASSTLLSDRLYFGLASSAIWTSQLFFRPERVIGEDRPLSGRASGLTGDGNATLE